MKKLILLIGNIGTGKSTVAKKYQEKGYVIIARDQLRYGIGLGNYIFNYDYEPVIWRTELYMSREFAELGIDILVDEVGLSKAMRKRYLRYAKELDYQVTALVMPRLSMKESVRRRLLDPHGQPDRKLWEGVWKKFDKIYEEPSKKEGIDEIIYLKDNFKPSLFMDCSKCHGKGEMLK